MTYAPPHESNTPIKICEMIDTYAQGVLEMLPFIQVVIFRSVTTCSDVVGYHRFRISCSLHLHLGVRGKIILKWVM
jgi:hypothetical protein